MRLITIPETQYTDYYDQSRFNLTWRINIFIFCTNLVLLPIMFFLAKDEFTGLLFSSVLALSYQVALYKIRKYEVVAVIWVVLGVLSTAVSLLTVPTLMHFTDLIFMFMVIVYAFFTLGKTAGIIVTAGNLVSITIYLIMVFNDGSDFLKDLSAINISKTIAFCIYGSSIIAFIFIEFLKLNKYAAQKYIEANNELEAINEIVVKRDEEKTVMLREIHHRVKNNLQVITSLLRLQTANENDELTLAKFQEATRRVAAMSLIHEKIYQSKDLARLDFRNYLESLSHDLIDSYAISTEISLDIYADHFDLSNRYFVPIALLCNELISNSLKHAFRVQEPGRIKVELKRIGKGRYHLNYADSGRWKEPKVGTTFGMELIDSLAEQLNGRYQRTADSQGTTYNFVLNSLTE